MPFKSISQQRLDEADRVPACVAACPQGALVAGPREALLRTARSRIAKSPKGYIDHIWGEHEIGGTSVLYLSDVNLAEAGWPDDLGTQPGPVLARKLLHTVPYTFFAVEAVVALSLLALNL